MNQRERILNALKLGPVCGTDMLRWNIARGAARIHELKAEGYQITTRPCKLHRHESAQIVYELETTDQMSLAL